MRLALATYQAVKYACMNFHYAESVPATRCSYSVYNNAGEWCGCIVFSPGSNRYIGRSYGLVQGQVCELVRMALNGKQESTSKALAIALKLLKKDNPLIRLVVSYADCDQEHAGTIYQATNWTYAGKVELNGGTPKYRLLGRIRHGRSIAARGWKQQIDWLRLHIDPSAQLVYTKGKHKYLYPFTKDMQAKCKSIAQPYFKKELHAAIAQPVECQSFQTEDGVRIDLAAQSVS